MIVVGLGANLPSRYGEPKETLIAAKAELEKRGLTLLAESKTYLTAPVPISDDPWYHNEVVAVETDLGPRELLTLLNEVEADFGRVRTVPNAPRLLDLDIIAYHDEIIDTDALVIPHTRMHERAFVLYPLRDIAPAWQHPTLGQSIDELITGLDPNQEIKVL